MSVMSLLDGRNKLDRQSRQNPFALPAMTLKLPEPSPVSKNYCKVRDENPVRLLFELSYREHFQLRCNVRSADFANGIDWCQ